MDGKERPRLEQSSSKLADKLAGGVIQTIAPSTHNLSSPRMRGPMACTLSLRNEGGLGEYGRPWIPAFAGMTMALVDGEELA
jgi:hypothetical protein